ncbi:MAG: glycerol-3-phosphate 1-O-acyltransferase PlsY [candidate division WOR-3 bacterium]
MTIIFCRVFVNMMNVAQIILSLLFGFLPGSIPFGYIAGLFNKVDIRKKGSGNIGFSNVLRTLGWRWALPVFILDISKGVIPVIFARQLELIPALVGFGAITGHIFTPWLKFQGGKGVATLIGVSALLCPRSLVVALVAFLIVLFLFGFISLSSISLALTLPIFTRFLYPDNRLIFLFTFFTGLIVILRHIPNIRRLTKRAEPKFELWRKIFQRQRV